MFDIAELMKNGELDLDVIDGTVAQLSDNSVWIQPATGSEVSLHMSNPSSSFRVGHQLRAVVSKRTTGLHIVRAINKSTSTEISPVGGFSPQDALDFSSLQSASFFKLAFFSVPGGPTLTMAMLIPGINWFFGAFLAIAMLSLIKLGSKGVKAYALGWVAFLIAIIAGASLGGLAGILYGIAVYAPTIGIMVTGVSITKVIAAEGIAYANKIDKLMAAG